MMTLFQTLLLQALSSDLDPVLFKYIEKVLPGVEQVFGIVSAFEKAENDRFVQLGKVDATQRVIYNGTDSEQSLLVWILNSLLIAWNLLPLLNSRLVLSDNEKRLLCLGLTFQWYNKARQCNALISSLTPTSTLEKALDLESFWAEWREYWSDIDYLAQTTQQTVEAKTIFAKKTSGKVPERRLTLPLRQLLAFGTIAAQLTDPADIVTKPEGDRLRKDLQALGIDRTLIYHRLRNGTGLLTNSIHNAVLHFAEKLDWQPLLFFAQGVVYLAPPGSALPDCSALQTFVWEQISKALATKMLTGESGFKRDGKGLKASPQTLELISPTQLIQNLPNVITATIKNESNPITLKRLERLELSQTERAFLTLGADLRSDRIAEFIYFLQKQYFGANSEFIAWVLEQLGIQAAITPEQTQIHTGGFYWGWYHAAAYYVASNPSLALEDMTAKLLELANQLVSWAEAKNLLPAQTSPTREIFARYLTQYLELPGWDNPEPSFPQELATYMAAKTQAARQPLCSLSAGEFMSEDQMAAVVLFKPQQYSNKNPLGGRQLKRGISKIWSLEMLLRQACWSVPAGKLEERQPVFLYLFPALVHAPQMTEALRLLVNQLKRVNLWDVRRFWQEHGMDANALRFYPWLRSNSNSEAAAKSDLPFLAITYTTTKAKTTTAAWIEPAFLALALPLVLGVKVVATPSPVPLYNSGSELLAMVQSDGAASFWHLLGLPTSSHPEAGLQRQGKPLSAWLDRLLIAYSIHLDCAAKPPDARWQAFPSTLQAIITNVLAIFSLAHSHLQTLTADKVQRYWHFAQTWAAGDPDMEQQLALTQRLAQEYRTFYRVHVAKSTHTIVLPLSKVLEDILSAPNDLPLEDLLLQTSGRLHDALRRQEPYKRPLIMDQSLSIDVRVNHELDAIQQFVHTCIQDLFLGHYKGDRALLQEHRHRIKSGVEFAYRLLAMQEPKTTATQQELEGAQL